MEDRPPFIEWELAVDGAFCDGGNRGGGFEGAEG